MYQLKMNDMTNLTGENLIYYFKLFITLSHINDKKNNSFS